MTGELRPLEESAKETIAVFHKIDYFNLLNRRYKYCFRRGTRDQLIFKFSKVKD